MSETESGFWVIASTDKDGLEHYLGEDHLVFVSKAKDARKFSERKFADEYLWVEGQVRPLVLQALNCRPCFHSTHHVTAGEFVAYVRPKAQADAERIEELRQGIKAMDLENHPVPQEWRDELAELGSSKATVPCGRVVPEDQWDGNLHLPTVEFVAAEIDRNAKERHADALKSVHDAMNSGSVGIRSCADSSQLFAESLGYRCAASVARELVRGKRTP